MLGVDSRMVSALLEQLDRRDVALRHGARRVGWKLGMGSRERIGDNVAVGYLTTNTVLPAGELPAAVVAGANLHVDAELCAELGADVSQDPDADAVRACVARCWPALEIVDLTPRPDEPESVVVDNIFHRAVAFGETPIPLVSAQRVSVYVNDRLCERAPWPVDIPERIAAATKVLAAVSECLRAGDRIITGSIIQVPVTIGDLARVEFGQLATLEIRPIAPSTAP